MTPNHTQAKERTETTIGLFDSGVGGLTVLQQLSNTLKTLPINKHFRLVYLGDTARCPYGNREPQEIASFVSQISNWLLAQGAESIVVACNTSAALAGHFARAHTQLPVYDLIAPTAKYVAERSLNVAVLATQSTVRSAAYSRNIKELNPALHVQEIACPELTPLVERGLIEDQNTLAVLKKYVDEIEINKIQAIVFGCTHYPFLSNLLKNLLPAEIQFIDPATYLVNKLTAEETKALEHEPIQATVSEQFYVTGTPESFAKAASICLKREIGTVYSISLPELIGISHELEPLSKITGSINSVKVIP